MRFGTPLFALLFLAACASLTEEQCRGGDWSSIGYNDGLNGRSAEYVGNHFEACEKIGITPDVAAWQQGREQGLLRYCTPENAYITGRNGNTFNNVCPASQSETLTRAYSWGGEYYDITQEILILTDESHEIELIIASELSLPDLTPEQAAQLARLKSRIRLIGLKIRRLTRQRERYAFLPV